MRQHEHDKEKKKTWKEMTELRTLRPRGAMAPRIARGFDLLGIEI